MLWQRQQNTVLVSYPQPQSWIYSLGSELLNCRTGECHPTRSFSGQSYVARWGAGFPKHVGVSAAFGLSRPVGLGMLSWARHLPSRAPVPAPPHLHALPLPSSILLPGLACPWSQLQPVTVPGYSPEMTLPISRSGRALGLSLCSPQALLSHHRTPFISKKTLFS